MRHALVTAIAIVLLCAASVPARQPDARSLEQTLRQRQPRNAAVNLPLPSNLTRRAITVGGSEREFFLHVPDEVRGRPAAVVFALHGGASNSGLQMHYKVDFTPLADREGFVVVYPSGQRGWNVGASDAFIVRNFSSTADDVGFFRAMFDALIEEKVADPDRIYVVGGSNGGMMTHRLACEFADRIAGAAAVVATLPASAPQEWPRPSRPVPFMLLLGTADPLVKYAGSGQTLSAAETVDFWRQQNHCVGEPRREDLRDRDSADGCRVRSERYDGDAPVLFYTMEGHGHGWPMQRDRQDGTGPKTRDISVPEETWKFFQGLARGRPAAAPSR